MDFRLDDGKTTNMHLGKQDAVFLFRRRFGPNFKTCHLSQSHQAKCLAMYRLQEVQQVDKGW